ALVDRGAQARIAAGITPAGAGGDADLADDLGEDLAALCVDGVLACFDGRTAPHGSMTGSERPADYTFCGPSPCSKRPSRRNAVACRAAAAENSRPEWLAGTRQWSRRPGIRVSSTATVPSDAASTDDSRRPTPRGTQPATTPTSALPVQPSRPRRSRLALRPSTSDDQWRVHSARAVQLPHSGEPRQTTRRTGSSGARRRASSATSPPRLYPTRSTAGPPASRSTSACDARPGSPSTLG